MSTPGTGPSPTATAAHPGSSSAGRMLLDPDRSGSVRSQVAIGIVGVLLAVVLVAGQVAVATTSGIAANVTQVNANLEAGNEVMVGIIEKSEPTPELAAAVERQAETLAHTRDTLVLLNAELDEILAETARMDATTGKLSATSSQIVPVLEQMADATEQIATTLGELPPITEATSGHLGSIARDSAAVNAELDALTRKLGAYGLVPAKGARR